MAKARGTGSVKRLGSRYGRKVRAKLAQVDLERLKKNKCPYCHYLKIKRISSGIYECNKCKSKFTGRAYNISKNIVIKEAVKDRFHFEDKIDHITEDKKEEYAEKGNGISKKDEESAKAEKFA
ncbi:MAG: hypothetical protein ABII01_03705 [Candidatus Woesearchaeota archaeon]